MNREINRLEIVKHSLSKGFLTPPSNYSDITKIDNVYGDGTMHLSKKIKKNELSLKRLRDAIEFIHFWDENDRLILANKKANDLHKSWNFPFKLDKGVKYKDLYKSLEISQGIYYTKWDVFRTSC